MQERKETPYLVDRRYQWNRLQIIVRRYDDWRAHLHTEFFGLDTAYTGDCLRISSLPTCTIDRLVWHGLNVLILFDGHYSGHGDLLCVDGEGRY